MRTLLPLLALACLACSCGRIGFDPLARAIQDDDGGVPEDGNSVGDGGTDDDGGTSSAICQNASDDNLMFWLRFEEESPTNLFDSSKNNLMAGCGPWDCPATVAGAIGNGYEFSGVQSLQVENFPADLPGTGYTLAAYASITTLTPTIDATLIAKRFGAGPEMSWWFGVVQSNVELWFGTTMQMSTPITFLQDEVAHIAVTWDEGGTARIYQNGVESAQATLARPNFDGNVVTIGTWERSNLDLVEYWPGMIDEVRVYSKALSPNEVATLANCRAL